MSEISTEWKELLPKIGNLISHINSENYNINEKLKELREKEERQAELQAQIDEAYNKGLDDAYNAMTYLYECEDCCSKALLCKFFGTSYIPTIIDNYSMGKIIVMVNHIKKENEEAKEKQDFHIGDEIICINECSMDYDKTFIYLGRDEYWMKIFDINKMKTESTNNFVDYRKTGKHYDAVPLPKEESDVST